MKARQAFLILTLLAAASPPLGVSLLRRRASIETPPGPAVPVSAVPLGRTDSVPPPSLVPRATGSAPTLEPRASGWLQVTLEIPEGIRSFSASAIVFSPEGAREVSEQIMDVTHFLLGPLLPGEKALLLYTADGRIPNTLTRVTAFEDQETEIVLRPPAPVRIEGVVVDAADRPLPGLEVGVWEAMPLERFRVGATIDEYAGREIRVGGGGGAHRSVGGGSSYFFSLGSEGLRFNRESWSDRQGRFSLWLGSGAAPVALQISRDYKVVMEQAIVPSAGPFRIIVPEPSEPPKK